MEFRIGGGRYIYCVTRAVKFMDEFVLVEISHNRNLLCICLLLIAHSSGKKPFLRTKSLILEVRTKVSNIVMHVFFVVSRLIE